MVPGTCTSTLPIRKLALLVLDYKLLCLGIKVGYEHQVVPGTCTWYSVQGRDVLELEMITTITGVQSSVLPTTQLSQYSVSVSFQPMARMLRDEIRCQAEVTTAFSPVAEGGWRGLT
jgi:hypothetical protein